MCLFWSVGKNRIFKRGESLLRVKSNKRVKWGLRESVVEATAKSERSRTRYPPASTRASIPQRRQLVRNSFCLSLSPFPSHRATFMNLDCQPLFSFIPPFSLCVCFISVSGRSGERQPLQWDCLSLSLYIYSYYSCCER